MPIATKARRGNAKRAARPGKPLRGTLKPVRERERLLSPGPEPKAAIEAVRQHGRTINAEVLPDEKYAAYGGTVRVR